MYIGLSLMNESELAEITRLIGVEHPPGSREILHDIVSGWLARAVKKEGCAQDEVERSVLEWTAQTWKIIIPQGTDTNDLERSLRLKIASDAAEFLSPGWALCCALVAVGRQDLIAEKLDLMEMAASTAVPSQKARRKKRQEWAELCRHWSKNDPAPELEPYITAVTQSPDLYSECLALGLALSLLDGQIGFPTERLYRDICDRLGMGRGDSDEIKAKVNDLYWKHHNAAVPTKTNNEGPKADPVRSATQKTIYGAGALEILAAEAKEKLFASLEPEQPKKKSGWSKLVGGLSGMSPFFSSKTKDDNQANLARVVYHTILKQHDAVVAAARMAHAGLQKVVDEKEAQAEVKPEPVVENVPPESGESAPAVESVESEPTPKPNTAPVGLSDLMVDVAEAPKRSIKLDL